jgi:hypothetical protein
MILETLTGVAPEAAALARYQATRDRLSQRLFDATESVASYAWDLVEVRALVRDVSAAMAEEVKHLEALPGRRVAGGPDAPLVRTRFAPEQSRHATDPQQADTAWAAPGACRAIGPLRGGPHMSRCLRKP